MKLSGPCLARETSVALETFSKSVTIALWLALAVISGILPPPNESFLYGAQSSLPELLSDEVGALSGVSTFDSFERGQLLKN